MAALLCCVSTNVLGQGKPVTELKVKIEATELDKIVLLQKCMALTINCTLSRPTMDSITALCSALSSNKRTFSSKAAEGRPIRVERRLRYLIRPARSCFGSLAPTDERMRAQQTLQQKKLLRSLCCTETYRRRENLKRIQKGTMLRELAPDRPRQPDQAGAEQRHAAQLRHRGGLRPKTALPGLDACAKAISQHLRAPGHLQ
jgi:hypothetical protein